MALLLNCQSVTKQFGSTPLFEGISFTIGEGERHGLIGPNGAGKTTLLAILSGEEWPDQGEVAIRKGTRFAYVRQDPRFPAGRTVRDIASESAREPESVPAILGQAGFADLDQDADSLSGGWRKRLAIVRALVEEPDLLLLDEPTNHLDIAGILWLEQLLESARFACLLVSHDRYFLENTTTHMLELNRAYPEGLFRVAGNYSEFLERREEWMEAQARQRESLASKVRREVEWLRRGAKARTRKSKARLDTAAAMIRQLGDMEQRARTETARIDFNATDRKTKRLVEIKGLRKDMGPRTLIRDLDLVLTPGMRLGLAGANGSGKTTLLRILLGETDYDAGTLMKANALRVVYFDQNRDKLDLDATLRRALAPDADSVIYQGRVVHVNAWARRFLFRPEQLDQPVSKLSGGERARVLIARLMLQEADLLLLDEPTNDLDIATLEVLEESLLEFPNALVLVTHDRYLMDRVCTGILGLDGEGGATLYADLSQWEADLSSKSVKVESVKPRVTPDSNQASPKKKLSYLEQREWDGMEARILEAEFRLKAAEDALHSSEVTADASRLREAYAELTAAQAEVEQLYARWAELEAKVTP